MYDILSVIKYSSNEPQSDSELLSNTRFIYAHVVLKYLLNSIFFKSETIKYMMSRRYIHNLFDYFSDKM